MVDESLDERLRSMVVGLMVNNERITAEIKKSKNNLETQKHELKKIKYKNGRLKLSYMHATERRNFICIL